MKNTKDKDKKYIWILASLMLLGLFLFLGNVSTLLPFRDFPGQVVVALLQAVITAVITIFLLKAQTREQTDSELKRERFSVWINKKSQVYDAFLKDLAVIANEGIKTLKQYEELVNDVNFKLGMYLRDDLPKEIEGILDEVRESPDKETFKKSLHKIVGLLRKDLNAEL